MPAVSYKPRYTVEDYLGWEGDWELWDGVAVSMAPSPLFGHNRAAAKLLGQIQNQLESNDSCGVCTAVFEVDWHVDDSTVVRPDLSVICGRQPVDWIKAAPALVAEFLSPSTREKDLTAKRDLYEKEGVKFYLIGDLDDKSLKVLELQDGKYVETDGKEMELHSGCPVAIDASRVFS